LREDYGERLDDQGREYLQEVSGAVARMNALVQDLLVYGRVSSISLPLESVSLADSVKQAVAQLESSYRAALKLDVPDSLLVQSHPQVLTQIVLNLLSNAFKFHKDGTTPEVNVSAQQRDGRVRLTVRDKGIGIAPQHQNRI